MSPVPLMVWLVVRRQSRYPGNARVITTRARPPRNLKVGEVAIRVDVEIPGEAFDPRFTVVELLKRAAESKK